MFVCVAGKNDISVEILEYLVERQEDRYEIGVVCNKNETGKDSWQKSLRYHAKKMGIREYALQEIYNMHQVLFLSLEFDQIIRPQNFADARLYNIHFSLLPHYRGMYTAVLPILYGETRSGVTLHRIDRGIDTGDIIAQEIIQIGEEDTSHDLYLKCMEKGTKLVIEYMDMLLDGTETAIPQEKSGATYFGRDTIDYSNISIDLRKTADQIKHQIRAFCFPEYQYPKVFGKDIEKVVITDNKSLMNPGEIVMEEEEYMLISTIDYDIKLYYPVG